MIDLARHPDCQAQGIKEALVMPIKQAQEVVLRKPNAGQKIFFNTYCFSKKKIENARSLNKTTWKYLCVCDPASEFV